MYYNYLQVLCKFRDHFEFHYHTEHLYCTCSYSHEALRHFPSSKLLALDLEFGVEVHQTSTYARLGFEVFNKGLGVLAILEFTIPISNLEAGISTYDFLTKLSQITHFNSPKSISSISALAPSTIMFADSFCKALCM